MREILVGFAAAAFMAVAGCVAEVSDAGSAAAFAREFGAGTQLIVRLDSPSIRPDFDGDGRADAIAVGVVPTGSSAVVDPQAFGYGPAPAGSRCLLILPGREAGTGANALCGVSPILALSEEQPVADAAASVRNIPRAQSRASLPDYVSGQMRGDALVLQTQAGESVLFFAEGGYRWKELPGGE